MKLMEIKKNIFSIGVVDYDLKVFDVIMETKYGSTYNAFFIKGSEKSAIIETVKVQFIDEYIEKLKTITKLEDVDYIVVNHTEPDHSGSIAKLLDYCVNAKVVGSKAALLYLKEIVNKDFEKMVVDFKNPINLGDKTLSFVQAPFLHWPDTIYTYVKEDKTLFTCDSFGSHYANDNLFLSKVENLEEYYDSLKYYYDCIFSPFKNFVLKAVDKVNQLDIDLVCPGHGPLLDIDFEKVKNLYVEWSTIEKQDNLVIMPYATSYGYTKEMAIVFKEKLEKEGFIVKDYNLDVTNINLFKEEIIQEIEKAKGLLIGSCTINQDAIEVIYDILGNLSPMIHGKKISAAFGSYGWSGEATINITERLKQLKMKVTDPFRYKFEPSDSDLQVGDEFITEYINLLSN